jgi:hypothetical protein
MKVLDAYYSHNLIKGEEFLIVPNHFAVFNRYDKMVVYADDETVSKSFWAFMDNPDYFSQKIENGLIKKVFISRRQIKIIDEDLKRCKLRKACNKIQGLYFLVQQKLQLDYPEFFEIKTWE